jgi:DNA-binding CsgD family transcriptional regulator
MGQFRSSRHGSSEHSQESKLRLVKDSASNISPEISHEASPRSPESRAIRRASSGSGLSEIPLESLIEYSERESLKVFSTDRLEISKMTQFAEGLKPQLEEARIALRANSVIVGERISETETYHFAESLEPGTPSRLGYYPLKPFRYIFELHRRNEENGYVPSGLETIELLNIFPDSKTFCIHDIDVARSYPATADVFWFWQDKAFAISPLFIDNRIRGAVSFSRASSATWTIGDCFMIQNVMRNVLSLLMRYLDLQLLARKIDSFYENAPPALKRLTPREKDVLVRLIKGWKDREIAEDLNISHSTVRKHEEALYLKTGNNTKAKLIAWGGGINGF